MKTRITKPFGNIFQKAQKKITKKLYVFTYAIFVVFNGVSANQTVINTNDSGLGSLRDAVSLVTNGDTIFFSPSIANSSIVVSSQITVATSVVFMGFENGDTITVNGNYTTRLFSVSSPAIVEFNNIDFTKGLISSGAAIFNNSDLTINKCRFYNNQSNPTSNTHGGGAIFNNTTGELEINNSEFFNNKAEATVPAITGYGGAIKNRGVSADVNFCSFYNNESFSPNSGAYGGAIHNSTTMNINSSTISANSTSSPGASGNYGGGISNTTGSVAVLTIKNSTISNNSSEFGGNIWNNGRVNLQNTIVANGMASSGSDILTDIAAGITTSLGNNILEYTTGATMSFTTGDVSIDPMLGALDYYGDKSTKTHSLACGSPAVNTGNSTNAPILDQTGRTRIIGSTIDKGAFELQSDLIAPTINQSGLMLSISQTGLYQWYMNNSPLVNDTNSIYSVMLNGDYYVVFTDTAGCSMHSDTVAFTTVGVEKIENKLTYNVYPNPASNEFTINNLKGNNRLILFDVLGKEVLTKNIHSESIKINVSIFNSGVYFIKISNEFGSHTKKIKIN